MPDSVDAQLRELRTQAEHARQQQARAQAERDSAQQQLEQAIAELKSEFGVTTPEQAAKLAESLEEQLAAEMQRVREQLQKAGVS